jgi:hypothetical protein
MPDAVYNWPVTCVCRTDRASVEFAQVHYGRDGSVERGPFGRRQHSDLSDRPSRGHQVQDFPAELGGVTPRHNILHGLLDV